MAHGLIMVNGKVPAVYAEDAKQWHGLGTNVVGAVSHEEVLEHAGIDFEVEKTPMYVRAATGEYVKIEGKVATRRTDTGDVLGAGLSEFYGIAPGRELLAFLQDLVQDAGMEYQSAGALWGGRTIWILARLGEEWTIGESRHVPYILATTTHDGSGSVTVTPTTVNVVCDNTLSAALAAPKDAQRVNIRHTSGVVDRLRAASDTLRVATADQRRLQAFLEAANETRVSGEQVAEVVAELFGARPSGDDATPRKLGSWERKVAGFKRIASEELKRSPNAFGLVQSVTGFADYALRPVSKAEAGPSRAFMSEFSGAGADFKRDGIDIIRKVVPELVTA